MADRVAVMRDGEIVQEATPVEIYQRPNSRFVASFIGQCSFAEGTVEHPCAAGEAGLVQCEWGKLGYLDDSDKQAGGKVTIAVRPENVQVLKGSEDESEALDGTVTEIVFLGESIECRVAVGNADLVAMALT